MVGVKGKSSADDLTSSSNPMIKYMLKVREQHARNQKHDYSHVFRQKTRWEMFRLSILGMAIELAYAAETSFVSPILLTIGIDHKLMTMAWGFSPLIGFFISPLLGSLSDRCTLSWGRRRPIITLLSIGIATGLILIPYGKHIGLILGDVGLNVTDSIGDVTNSIDQGEVPVVSNFKIGAILTILGMVLLDFDADTCQTPARTFMLDMCTPEDQPRALTSFTLLAGFGGTIGYAIGGINWENTQIGTFLGGNIPTVFGICTIIFIISFLITITTFREIPLKLIERDSMLKPLSKADIEKELLKNNSPVFYIKETSNIDNQMTFVDQKYGVLPIEGYQNGTYTDSVINLATDSLAAATSRAAEQQRRLSNLSMDSENEHVSLGEYLKSVFVMPYSIRMLALTNLACWMGHVTYCLYFTDFVGEAVFLGDPAAPPNSHEAQLYEEGVRFGCWGMSIYAFSCFVYCMIINKLRKWFGTKLVYIFGMVLYGICMLILGLWPTKWGVLCFSISAGIIYGTLFTIPYILVANYHSQNCFRVQNGETIPLNQNRGLGTDVAIISSMVFVAQLIVSVSIGPLISWMQSTCAILFASTFFAFIAAIFALFVLYV